MVHIGTSDVSEEEEASNDADKSQKIEMDITLRFTNVTGNESTNEHFCWLESVHDSHNNALLENNDGHNNDESVYPVSEGTKIS